MRKALCAFVSILALTCGVRADEIRLKDGSKIIGNIVGYEDGAFRVETAYGFATIRKDSIVDIITTDAKQSAPPKVAPSKPAEEPSPAPARPAMSADAKPQPASLKPAAETLPDTKAQPASARPSALIDTKDAKMRAPAAAKSSPQLSAAPAPATATAAPAPVPAATLASPAATRPAATATNLAPASATSGATTPAPAPAAAAAPPQPVAAPEPPPVRELVRGNLYINQTYGFEMYRAPDWQPIDGARAALPNAVAALGTSDQSTLLIIGRERAHDSLEAQSAATEKAIEEIYENYRPMPPVRTMIAGLPAIERHFRGAAEKRDWSVVLVTLVRDGDVFTILAMTDANSELVQIQENVIAKAVASLQFNAPHS